MAHLTYVLSVVIIFTSFCVKVYFALLVEIPFDCHFYQIVRDSRGTQL